MVMSIYSIYRWGERLGELHNEHWILCLAWRSNMTSLNAPPRINAGKRNLCAIYTRFPFRACGCEKTYTRMTDMPWANKLLPLGYVVTSRHGGRSRHGRSWGENRLSPRCWDYWASLTFDVWFFFLMLDFFLFLFCCNWPVIMNNIINIQTVTDKHADIKNLYIYTRTMTFSSLLKRKFVRLSDWVWGCSHLQYPIHLTLCSDVSA